MKKKIRLISGLTLAIIMAWSSLVVVSAVENPTADDNPEIVVTISNDDGSTRAYELVWKFKSEFGHMYKRRWNATLGMWYDPEWILVY